MQYNEYRNQVQRFIQTARATYEIAHIMPGTQRPFAYGYGVDLICCPIGAAMYPIYCDRGYSDAEIVGRQASTIYDDFTETYPFTAYHVPRTFCEQYIPHVLSHGSYLMRDNETSPLWRLIYLLNDHGGFVDVRHPQSAIEAVLYHAYSHIAESD